jgi:hypothetical protein
MTEHATTSQCPECGSRHVIDITLPIPADAPPHARPTRRAHRCLDCSSQWPPPVETRVTTEEQVQ